MAKFAEDDRIEQMNAQKRRMKQLEHRRAVEKLIEERRLQYEREKVCTCLYLHTLQPNRNVLTDARTHVNYVCSLCNNQTCTYTYVHIKYYKNIFPHICTHIHGYIIKSFFNVRLSFVYYTQRCYITLLPVFSQERELEEWREEQRMEEMRRTLIEEERQRLLQEHASKLLGYLPKGVLRNDQDLGLFDKNFQDAYQKRRVDLFEDEGW